MLIDIKVPAFPESVQEGEVATWHKQVGDTVQRDDLLVDVETDKVVLEVVAAQSGVLVEILKEEGALLLSGEVMARFESGAVVASPASADATASTPEAAEGDAAPASPAARKLADEKGIDLVAIAGSGKDGRITKEDVVNFVAAPVTPAAPAAAAVSPTAAPPIAPADSGLALSAGERVEKRVPMTRMRARIAERLLDVTQTTAMLTTFNEVDMHRIMDLRTQFKDQFTSVHNGTRLGFMGFFVRSAVEALKRFPLVNASLDGSDVVYHGYQDIGVAVSSDRGLVVPVLRDVDQMSIAEIENKIAEYGGKARDGKLSIDEITGGTFTITNGGVFGSLVSTPILNPPQAAILGMHAIKERPIAEDGKVVIRPMMNLALSYDHRIIDGRDAVLFLVAIKDMIENPAKILLEI
ncbi:MAG: 2-oxoglutarate dehydrogenase complex dihydrolipoyllysine-residue succinyltransferase [Gammaproteobacteria bacterium]|nr:2-oxoglutarate dehydrogenase complex dihydrolipoyllysine-residue succinyltransferase [Gammaproteobacteria bacterium]MBQ0839052.1 2-oxoglutarate dehydrogenase complex dihydrolipoyllysine-residue succinyltransferase [Gammaproteobacteria bacterium]